MKDSHLASAMVVLRSSPHSSITGRVGGISSLLGLSHPVIYVTAI